MSFILDALKKSELERQRQSMPGLIEMPMAARRRGVPVWVWVLVGLLCINVAMLLVVLLRGGSSGMPRTPVSAAAPAANEPRTRVPTSRELQARNVPPAPEPEAAAPETPADNAERSARPSDHFSPLDNQPVYAPEIPVQDEGAAAPSGSSTGNPGERAAPAARAAHRSDPVLNDEPPEDQEMLPSISELNLTGKQSLPDINIDVHVYASRPADRFVYINMRKYREGAVLQEGPTLERIRRDGVVLNYNGLRFLVPRQ
jgi:general secretion pathway protein B